MESSDYDLTYALLLKLCYRKAKLRAMEARRYYEKMDLSRPNSSFSSLPDASAQDHSRIAQVSAGLADHHYEISHLLSSLNF